MRGDGQAQAGRTRRLRAPGRPRRVDPQGGPHRRPRLAPSARQHLPPGKRAPRRRRDRPRRPYRCRHGDPAPDREREPGAFDRYAPPRAPACPRRRHRRRGLRGDGAHHDLPGRTDGAQGRSRRARGRATRAARRRRVQVEARRPVGARGPRALREPRAEGLRSAPRVRALPRGVPVGPHDPGVQRRGPRRAGRGRERPTRPGLTILPSAYLQRPARPRSP